MLSKTRWRSSLALLEFSDSMTASELINILSVLPSETIIAYQTYRHDEYSSEDARGFEWRQAVPPNKDSQVFAEGRPPRLVLQ